MRNGNGVEITMVSTAEGADLEAPISGVTFTVVTQGPPLSAASGWEGGKIN